MEIQPFTLADYDETIRLWKNTPGIGLSNADSLENLARFLERNQGLSFVARDGDRLAGAVLGSHDGRRGTITHLAVAPEYRKQGIGRRLTEAALDALRGQGIERCHIHVYRDNLDGLAYWKGMGWYERPELTLLSLDLGKEG